MIKVKIVNGLALELKAQTEAGEALKALGVASDHRVVAALVDGEMLDLSRPLAQDCTIAPILLDSPEGLTIMRHSAAPHHGRGGALPLPGAESPSARPSKAAFTTISRRRSPSLPRTWKKSRAACGNWWPRTSRSPGTKNHENRPSPLSRRRVKPIRSNYCRKSPRKP